MQVYKNRPVMPTDQLLWHYTTRNAVVAMVNEGQMRLTRIDAFEDPFEGSVPRQSIEDQGVILRGCEMMQTMMGSVATHYPGHHKIPQTQYRDRWSEMTQRRRAMTRSARALHLCSTASTSLRIRHQLSSKSHGPTGSSPYVVGSSRSTDHDTASSEYCGN